MDADRQVDKAKRDEERRRLAMAIMRAEAEQKAGVRFQPLRDDEQQQRPPAAWGVRG